MVGKISQSKPIGIPILPEIENYGLAYFNLCFCLFSNASSFSFARPKENEAKEKGATNKARSPLKTR
ncbi:MAG: hypothetical protein KDC79_13325 [Cyclobacteriaceae bacterium]|nr:hypothetical protein [Cyclobacteriaceae bacterium]